MDQPIVTMLDRFGREIAFDLVSEEERLPGRMGRSMPSIEMAYDNDAESEWGEIEGCLSNLTLALSLAAYDNRVA
jgi:hypothetical protein